MRGRHLGYLSVLAAAFSLSATVAAANCQLQQLGTMPVDMQGLAPIVTTKINGVEARFILDSGSFYSMISDDAAARYRLQVASVSSGSYGMRDSRGLVYLRLERWDDAIQDYDTALRTSPSMATSLYGRGIAELRLGEQAQGQADLAAAEKVDKGVAKRFTDMGFPP